MDRSALGKQMPSLVAGHLPSNARKFTFRVYDAIPDVSTFGFYIDPKPFLGTIVNKTDDAIVVKVARTKFAVLDRHLVSDDPIEGSKVEVTPYARRDFDGRRMDAPVESADQLADGTPYTTRTIVLGGKTTHLPLPEPRCPELAALIRQIEQLPAPDGRRRIAHVLVDAGARDFRSDDPPPNDIVRTPPGIHFTVASAQFAGQVSVIYERAHDLYTIVQSKDGNDVYREEDLDFSSLGAALTQLIDDGQWRIIQVRCLTKSKPGSRSQVKASARHG